MARTVRKIDIVGSQSFSVVVNGLNINTLLNVYYDNQLVPAADLEPKNGKVGDAISTNSNGAADFIFYLKNPLGDFKDKPEATFIDFLSKDASAKTLVIVDKASVNDASLPNNYQTRSRCYATYELSKAFKVTFTEIKDWGDQTETLSPYDKNYGDIS